MKGFVLFLCAITGGGIAVYGALTHGPIPGLHVDGSISSISLMDEIEASPLMPSAAEELPPSLRERGVSSPLETEEEIIRSLDTENPDNVLASDKIVAGTHKPVVTSEPTSLADSAEFNDSELVKTAENKKVSETDEAAEKQASSNLINLIDFSRYDAIRGKDCKLGLKEIGFRALSLRSGSFRDGETLLWEESFSKNKRISMFYASKDPIVTVNALAFDQNGNPQAAFVTEKSSGKEGVIALFVEEKKVPLIPVK